MLMMSDPFRQLDRLAQQVFGTAAHPAAMPLDAWREDTEFVVAVDLPGVDVDSIDVAVERNVLTVKAERKITAPEGAAQKRLRSKLYGNEAVAGRKDPDPALAVVWLEGVAARPGQGD